MPRQVVRRRQLGAPASWHRDRIADAIGHVVYYGALTRTALEERACTQAVAGAIETARATGELQANLAALDGDARAGARLLAERVGDTVRDLGHDVIAACTIQHRARPRR